MVMRKNARAAEKTGEHHVAARGVAGTRGQQVRRDDSQKRAQLENIPALTPQDGNGRVIPRERVTLSRDGFDERRFTASVGPEDADVLAAGDFQVDIQKSLAVATYYSDSREGEQGNGRHKSILAEQTFETSGLASKWQLSVEQEDQERSARFISKQSSTQITLKQ